MEKYKKPIGVFDSGVGGLTVLESLMKKFPEEDFIYVADQGHCPYGVKKEEEIIECVLNVGRYLISKDVKAIVIACNTASLEIKYLEEITSIPVISVIKPTCMKAIKTTKTNNVAVLGTVATISKGKYQELLEKHGKKAYAVACSEFVDFIENHELSDPEGQRIVDEKLEELKNQNIDTLIHGCTHFSIIEDKMRKVLGDINYIACGEPTSEELFEILNKENLLNKENKNRYVRILTTGSALGAINTMKWFKMPHEEIKHIDLND